MEEWTVLLVQVLKEMVKMTDVITSMKEEIEGEMTSMKREMVSTSIK